MCKKLFKVITILLVSVHISVCNLVGNCNQCFANSKIACIDENHFSTCFEGSPTATITKCPDERFCTADVLICHTADEGYTPSCYHNYCGDCTVSNGVFTCLDETTYGYCFGGTTPLPGTMRSCPSGFVCNYNSREVCVPENINQPSCIGQTTTTDPSTTDTTELSTIPTDTTTDFTRTTEVSTETTSDVTSSISNTGTDLITESTPEETKTTDISSTDITTTTISTTEISTTTEISPTEINTTTEIPTTETTTTTEISTTLTTITTEIPTTQTTEIPITQTTEVLTTETTTTIEIETTLTQTPTTQTTTEIPTTQARPTTEISTTQFTVTTETPTTTTTAAPRDAQRICTDIGLVGYFKSDDPTCRQYVYCYPLSGQYLGWFYYCDGYFNAATKRCQKERPVDCKPL